MCWLLLFFSFCITLLDLTSGERNHQIYWNASNPMFRQVSRSESGIIDIREGDKLQFICPNDRTRISLYWTSDLYSVQLCKIDDSKQVFELLMCDSSVLDPFYIEITQISEDWRAPNFKFDEPVYFLANTEYCKQHKMKFSVIMRTEQDMRRIDENKNIEVEESVSDQNEDQINRNSDVRIEAPKIDRSYGLSTWDQYRYLIIMAIFAGVALIGVHLVLCFAWIPSRLSRKRRRRELENAEQIRRNGSQPSSYEIVSSNQIEKSQLLKMNQAQQQLYISTLNGVNYSGLVNVNSNQQLIPQTTHSIGSNPDTSTTGGSSSGGTNESWKRKDNSSKINNDVKRSNSRRGSKSDQSQAAIVLDQSAQGQIINTSPSQLILTNGLTYTQQLPIAPAFLPSTQYILTQLHQNPIFQQQVAQNLQKLQQQQNQQPVYDLPRDISSTLSRRPQSKQAVPYSVYSNATMNNKVTNSHVRFNQ